MQTGLWSYSQEPARSRVLFRRVGFTEADVPLLTKESATIGTGAEPCKRILPLHGTWKTQPPNLPLLQVIRRQARADELPVAHLGISSAKREVRHWRLEKHRLSRSVTCQELLPMSVDFMGYSKNSLK